MLRAKLLGDWESLEFMRDFWNLEYDERDILQYRRLAPVWRMRESGASYKQIANKLGEDTGKCCALVSGKNCRPYLAQMYLNREVLGKPRNGWKWILERTPKPTAPYPKALQVPEQITSYQDIVDFLNQFPQSENASPSSELHVTPEWVEKNKQNLFAFLLGFMVGDAGKNYPKSAENARTYDASSLDVNMKRHESNQRLLRFVEMCLNVIGLQAKEVQSPSDIVRVQTEYSRLLTWILRTCLGITGEMRTSEDSIDVRWMHSFPPKFVVSFLQAVADSDGSVDPNGYYVNIESKPNSAIFGDILKTLGTNPHVYEYEKQSCVRISLREAVQLPIFNEIVQSYRYHLLIQHALRRNIPPPSLLFSLLRERKYTLEIVAHDNRVEERYPSGVFGRYADYRRISAQPLRLRSDLD